MSHLYMRLAVRTLCLLNSYISPVHETCSEDSPVYETCSEDSPVYETCSGDSVY